MDDVVTWAGADDKHALFRRLKSNAGHAISLYFAHDRMFDSDGGEYDQIAIEASLGGG